MKLLKNILKSELFLIGILYSAAYGIMLFNNGIFWDDWVFYKAPRPVIMGVQAECGRPWFGYYLMLIFSFKSLIVPRLIVFSAFLFSAFFLNGILKSFKEIERPSRVFLVLFFALFPVNFARVILCASQYSICLLFLFFGIWLFDKYLQSGKIVLRFLCLFVLFISFFTESVLVFYLTLVLILIFYKERRSIFSLNNLLPHLFRYADFLALPFVFWFMKQAFFKPWGHYAAYNHISARFIVASPIWLIRAFEQAFIAVLNSAFNIFLSNMCLSVIFGFIVFLLLSEILKAREDDDGFDLRLFFLGLVLFSLAVFPYIATGTMPNLYDWNSRHQLLVGLGASFTLYYGIRIFLNRLGCNRQARLYLNALIVAMFISVNFMTYLAYQKDWFKQLSLIEQFRSSRIIRENTTFIFDDQTAEMNAQKRVYRVYEYAGLMKFALNDETRFGVDLDLYNKTQWNRFFIGQPQLNISGYKPKDPDFRVVIRSGPCDISEPYQVIRILGYKIFAPDKFKEAITGIVKLEYTKL